MRINNINNPKTVINYPWSAKPKSQYNYNCFTKNTNNLVSHVVTESCSLTKYSQFENVTHKKSSQLSAYRDFLIGQTLSFKGNPRELLNKDYETLTEEEKDILRKELEPFQYDIIDDCIQASKAIKSEYDKKYGENNWEYVSIGRSCANIAKTLELLGVKSHIIPISGLSHGIKDGAELTKQEGFEGYRDYIYSLGLNPTNIDKSNKKYIFQDYSDTGKTIKIFEEFIRSQDMDLNKNNIIFESINTVLERIKTEQANNTFDIDTFILKRLRAQNNQGSLKSYTSSPKLNYKELAKIREVVSRPELTYNKLFDFGIKDRIAISKLKD